MNTASNKKAGIPETRGAFTYMYYTIHETQFKQTFKCEFEKGKNEFEKNLIVSVLCVNMN